MKKWLAILVIFAAFYARAVPVSPIVQPHVTFVDAAGLPCSGCTLATYAAGTTTPLATYVDSTGTSTNTNPIVLDAAGGANIWLANSSYKFVLKSALSATIWTVDNVKGGGGLGGVCGPANAVQIANSAVNGLTCSANVTINPITGSLNVGTLPANYVTIGALGTPTSWTLDTTTPASALASMGGGTSSGTINQIAIYPATGAGIVGSSSLPAGITVITQAPSDNSGNPASTGYVALPGAIAPSSLALAAGTAMTANQGTGTSLQHSTGAPISGNFAEFDATGNTVDSGVPSAGIVGRTCGANGCYKVDGDGTIEEWGTVNAPTSGGTLVNIAITYPLPFPTAMQSLTVSGNTQPDGADDAYVTYTKALSLSGATAVVRCSVNIGGSGCSSLSTAVPVSWRAVGY